MSYLVVSGICVYDIKEVNDSTLSQHDKEVKRMEYESDFRYAKFCIANNEEVIIEFEQALGGRGESSIIRYY